MGERYDDVVAELDLAAKVRLLTGASFFALHRRRRRSGCRRWPCPTARPASRACRRAAARRRACCRTRRSLASTWDEALLREVGELLADEAIRQGVDVVLGPTINLHRSPLGGRLFECFSEDPLLTGRLAAAYVRGLQARGVGACLKHLVGNEAETERHTVDVRIDEATLREVYLLPFEIAVADANPWMLMAAYNRVNGVPATEHDAVSTASSRASGPTPALVVSDFFATHVRRPGDQRRARPRDARTVGPVGRRPGRCRRGRRGRRRRPSTTPSAGCSGWPTASAHSAGSAAGRRSAGADRRGSPRRPASVRRRRA